MQRSASRSPAAGDRPANRQTTTLRRLLQRALWGAVLWSAASALALGVAAALLVLAAQYAGLPRVGLLIPAAAAALACWILLVRACVRNRARRIARPVENLLLAAQDLAAGHLKEDITLDGTTEIAQLARTLNRLRTLLAMAEVKFRTLFAHTSNHIVLLEPDSHLIVDANRAFEHLIRRKRRELVGYHFLDLFDAACRAALVDVLQSAEKNGQAFEEGLLCTLPGELRVYLDISMNLIQVRTERILEVSFKDVTDSHIKKQELVEIANTDDLTGLYNQRAFHERVPRVIATSQEEGRRLCMLFLDLDNFKRCNDTFGHQVGDELLRRVGRIINDNIRRDRDMGFRIGGDEFAILLPRASAEIGERIAGNVARAYGAQEAYGTTMSIGIAMLQPDMDFQALVRKTDDALYAAKSAGRDTIHIAGAPTREG
jgi:diguanylate cyclase (GGDEF)-like protein